MSSNQYIPQEHQARPKPTFNTHICGLLQDQYGLRLVYLYGRNGHRSKAAKDQSVENPKKSKNKMAHDKQNGTKQASRAQTNPDDGQENEAGMLHFFNGRADAMSPPPRKRRCDWSLSGGDDKQSCRLVILPADSNDQKMEQKKRKLFERPVESIFFVWRVFAVENRIQVPCPSHLTKYTSKFRRNEGWSRPSMRTAEMRKD